MYAKLFGSVLDSSLWEAALPTRVLFITMLAMADREGYVYASRLGLARRACLSPADFDRAMVDLQAPDPDSSDLLRAPERNGRRVERTETGWVVVNYAYYRDLRDQDERRDQDRLRKRKQRARSRSVTLGHVSSRDVRPQSQSQSQSKTTTTKRKKRAPVETAENLDEAAG